jgi:hypothetical protein
MSNNGFYNPVNLDLKQEFPNLNELELDKLQYLIHLIYEQRALYRIKTEYVPLKALYLRKILRDQKYYRELLENAGIIECDHTYIKRSKSFGLKLTDKYAEQDYNKVPIKTQKITKKILETKTDLDPNNKIHHFLFNNLKKVNINYEEAYKLLDISDKDTFIVNKIRLGKIHNKDWFFKQDEYGRVHTNLTTLSSKYRAYLDVENENLINIDIRNSQPLFLLLTLREEIQEHTIRCALFETNNELTKYADLVQVGNLYEFFSEVYNCDRDSAKKKIFVEIFGKKISKEFRAVFPNLSQVIDDIKGKDYRRVAWMMQRKESQLMINQVCGDLLAQDENIFLATIHDSILTTKQNVDATKTAILTRFNALGISPTLKVETLAPSREAF